MSGKNLMIEARYAEEDLTRLPALAAELVSLAPDVIVGSNSASTAALQKATSSIPIVMGTPGDSGRRRVHQISRKAGRQHHRND